MDKQNYILKESEIQELRKSFSRLKSKSKKELEQKIFQRKRVLKSFDLLLKAILLYFVDQLSFQRLSDAMACRYKIVMSDTAWRKQFLKAAPILLEWAQKGQAEENASTVHPTVLGCSCVYAIDATDLPMQGGNATARRVHTLFSLSQHRSTYVDVSDRHGGESLTRFPLHQGALYLADRAYGRTPQLAYAIEQQAHVITRISPLQTTFYTTPDCKEKISFPSLLEGDSFSTFGYFKWKKIVYHVRLLGQKLPQEKQALSEKRVRRRASRNQRKLSDETLEYTKWIFLATTLADSYSDIEIIQTYRLRWQIELHFKRIKSFLNFHKIRRSCDAYQDGIVFLWIALSFLLASLQLRLLCFSNFSISEYNAFSLAKIASL